MNSFDDVRLTWNKQLFVIPANHVLGAIARVEDVITFHELMNYSSRQTTPVAKLSEAYGALLRYAGADVTDEEVYSGMFAGLSEGVDGAVNAAIETLLLMMIPKAKRAEMEKEQNAGKPKPAAARRKASPGKRSSAKKALSKAPGKRSSARTG